MSNIGTKEEQQMYEMLQALWARIESVDDVFEEVSGYMNGMRSAQSENEALRGALEMLLRYIETGDMRKVDLRVARSALATHDKESRDAD